MGLAQVAKQALLTGGLGIKVERAAAALGAIATSNLFTISNGSVLITLLIGEVVTVLTAAATTIRLQHLNGVTAGATALDNAALNVNAEPAGTIWTLPDVTTASPIQNQNADVPIANYALGVLKGNIGIIAPAGNIQLIVAGANSLTGSVRWSLFYIPLFSGATVTA